LGRILQRLFSTFPNGWPGVGLILLRACLGAALLYFGSARLANASILTVCFQGLVATAGGVFLLAGLWTPLAGSLAALDEIWIAASAQSPSPQETWIHIFLAILAASVAMLGPGAWSIDARLFGRRRIDIDRSWGRKPSL